MAYGHVGNSAAVFPLQRLGHEVWPVYTVNFSNHTGYGAWRGPIIDAESVRDVIVGIQERGALAEVDVVLSGYQGSPAIAEVILEAVERVRAANPAATYTADPVMGNALSGCYVNPEIPPLMRELVIPKADLVTPNQFELSFLTGEKTETLEQTLDAVEALKAQGPTTVLVTSVLRPETPADRLEMLVSDPSGAWIVETPRLPKKINGSGDVTAALFTAHYRSTGDPRLALERTASSVFDLLKNTQDAGSRELLLVENQDLYVDPAMQFTATAIG